MRVHPFPLAAVFLCASAAVAAPRTFSIDSDASKAEAHVGKTGLGSFAGHEHVVLAPLFRGEVVADVEDLARSSVNVEVSARALKVREEGEPEGDAPKVQEAMKSRKVLDVARFAVISFRSTQVSGTRNGPDSFELSLAGELSLHGVKKPFTVPVKVRIQGDTLTATGQMTVKQRDFGIQPVTAAGGLVQVADEVGLTFALVAKAR